MPDARLEVTDALGRRIVPIAKGQFEIGRRETNDLRLAGSEVSRDHAEIALQAGDVDLIDFTREGELFRRNEIEVEGGHGIPASSDNEQSDRKQRTPCGRSLLVLMS